MNVDISRTLADLLLGGLPLLLPFRLSGSYSKVSSVCSGGDEDEEFEDVDTGDSAADPGTPIHTVEGGEVSEAGTAQQDTAGLTTQEPAEAAAEAADVAADVVEGSAGSAEGADQPPGLEDLGIKGSAVAGPDGQETGKEGKQRKKKEPRFPHWYSLKA